MKYKNLHFIKFFFVMILLVIFLAVLILGFCWFFYLLPIDFPGTVGDWIAGLSALTGGALTLSGVWWTIKEQNNNLIKQQDLASKQRREDLAIQYRPIIIENVVSCGKENNIICFTNVGRGELLNVKVYSTNKNIIEVKIRDTKLVGTIPVGGSIEVICFCKFNKYNYLLDNHSEKEVSIIIKGDNIFKNQKITFEFIYRTSIQGDDKPVLNSHNTIYSFDNFNEND